MIKEEEKDNDSVLVRTEVLNNIRNGEVDTLITYPEALAEKGRRPGSAFPHVDGGESGRCLIDFFRRKSFGRIRVRTE